MELNCQGEQGDPIIFRMFLPLRDGGGTLISIFKGPCDSYLLNIRLAALIYLNIIPLICSTIKNSLGVLVPIDGIRLG